MNCAGWTSNKSLGFQFISHFLRDEKRGRFNSSRVASKLAFCFILIFWSCLHWVFIIESITTDVISFFIRSYWIERAGGRNDRNPYIYVHWFMTARNTRKKNIKIIVVIVKKYIFQESNRIILHHHCFLLCVFATTLPLLFMSSELPTTLVDKVFVTWKMSDDSYIFCYPQCR